MFILHGFQIVTHKDIHNQQLQPISIVFPFPTGKNYTNRLQLLIVYVFMCNNLETMKNKHEMSGKGKTVVFPCDSAHIGDMT